MTVWRDLQEQAEQLGGRRRWQPVRVLGIEVPNGLSKGIKEDGLYPLAQGKKLSTDRPSRGRDRCLPVA